MQRTFKKTQTSKWNVNKKEKQNIWTSEIPPGLFYVFKNRLYFSCKICLAKKKKKERIFKDLKLHKTLSKENHGLRDTACVLQ